MKTDPQSIIRARELTQQHEQITKEIELLNQWTKFTRDHLVLSDRGESGKFLPLTIIDVTCLVMRRNDTLAQIISELSAL